MVEAVPKVSDSSKDLPTLIGTKAGLVTGGCIITKMVGKCGPYRYHVVKVDGKQKWTYLGKGGTGGTKHERGLVNVPDDESTRRHESGKPCPVTGKEIPENTIYTDHKYKEIFNSCGACGENKTGRQRLVELNERREQERVGKSPEQEAV